MTEDIYRRLSNHLCTLGMGYPPTEDLEEILKANFTPPEAEVAMALPTRVAPLQPVRVDDINAKANLPREELVKILEGLTQRGLLFSGKTKEGERGYALQQVGYGFPQSFFWKGEETPHAKNMADLIAKYFNRKVTAEAYASSETKAFRYIPVGETIDRKMQAVYPYDMMENVIEKARAIAVAHCACRIAAQLRGKGCSHPLEVCLKYDEIAEYLVERELAREVTQEEALQIVKKSEEAGLVHLVDNAMGDIKHTCNCCGCACWSVGTIKRRKVPRDVLMATYFIRETDEDKCIGCGNCAEVCPVEAVAIEDNLPSMDADWCIGCGICVAQCSASAAKLRPRTGRVPPHNFTELHERILKEKGAK